MVASNLTFRRVACVSTCAFATLILACDGGDGGGDAGGVMEVGSASDDTGSVDPDASGDDRTQSSSTGGDEISGQDDAATSVGEDGRDSSSADASETSASSASDTANSESAGSSSDDSTTSTSDDETGTSTTSGSDSTESSSDTGESSADTTTEGDGCPELTVTFASETPTVHLLIDQSGSMDYDLGDSGMTRWDVVEDVLVGSSDSVIAALEDDVRFGLSMYTGQPSECPMTLDVSASIGNYNVIKTLFDQNGPLHGTPTAEAVEISQALLEQVDEPGSKILVLATDGDPHPCSDLAQGDGKQGTLDAVTAAYGVGIETYVIAVGDGASTDHLTDLARAGKDDASAMPFFANDRAALIDAFESIVNGARECVFDLSQAIKPGFESMGSLTINGVEQPYDDPNGWRVNSSTEIELLGAACDMIKEGEVEVKVDFDCIAIDPQ